VSHLTLLCTTSSPTLLDVDYGRKLADVLRRVRLEEGLSHRDMAKRLGVSHATYTRMEHGDQNVTLRTLTKVCRAFDCDMGELFRGEVRLRRRSSALRR
jgi:transcriptional regulator with XRE-family HTH domain